MPVYDLLALPAAELEFWNEAGKKFESAKNEVARLKCQAGQSDH